MSNQNGIESDPLFGGLTRPPTFLGLPIEAMLGIMGVSVVAFLIAAMVDAGIAWKIFPLGFGVVMYAVARLICASDPRSFRYIGLRFKTKALHRTRAHWKSGSYSPLPHRKR